jgi:hypothetical protein
MGASSPGWRKTGGLARFGAVAGLQNGSSSIVVTVSRQSRSGQTAPCCAVQRAGCQKARAPRCVLSRSCCFPSHVRGNEVRVAIRKLLAC